MSRSADFPIDPRFVERWSARAMSGESLAETDVRMLLEAARWAPSASNVQPWRFSYALAGTPYFAALLAGLVPTNQTWCSRAGALVVVMSRTQLDNGNPIRSHAFDTGAAWMSLALQGARDGLVVHAMLGIDEPAIRAAAAVPGVFAIQCVVALGRPGSIEALPEQLRARELPSSRRAQHEWAVQGAWPQERS